MIKTLARHIRGFIKESIATPLFMILEVIMEMLVPFLMAALVDNGINGKNGGYIKYI